MARPVTAGPTLAPADGSPPTTSGHHRLMLGLIRVLMAASLLTVLGGSLYFEKTFDSLRATSIAAVETVLTGRQLSLALEAALADERLARLARDAATLRAATIRFDADAARGMRALDVLVAPTIARAPFDGGAMVDVPTTLTRLRRLLPGAPGMSAQAAPVDDQQVLDASDAAIRMVTDRALDVRRAGIARIRRRERLDLATSLTALTLFVVLLGGSAARLVVGRQRLLAARRTATEQAQLLDASVNHMRDGVAVFDSADRLILSNGRLAEVGGLPDPLVAAGTSFEAFSAAFAEADPPLLEQARPRVGAPVSGEMRVGGRVIAIYRSHMPSGGQMLTLSDVTQRVEADELVRRAQRMDVLGRLTGGVAHDFNNLLQALAAGLDVLAAETEGAGLPAIHTRINEAQGAVERGTRLTRHLLAFARRQQLASVTLDTRALLTGLEDLLARTLGDAFELLLHVSPDLWPVEADPAALENAVINLVLNGRDAMPDGGRLVLDARNEPADDPTAGQVRITVTDHGTGMTAEQMARAVEPFYSTKAFGAGTGLGLSLVDGFARQSGGAFSLAAVTGGGVEATLRLPRAASGPPAAAAPVRAARGRGEAVLLVEDDPAVCRASREALEQLGYAVTEACDAGAAWRLLDQYGLRPDLLFSDVMMPGPMDVAALVRQARGLLPDLPIVFNTGDVEARVLTEVRFDDRMKLLAKPWRLAEMSRQLRDLLDASRREAFARDA